MAMYVLIKQMANLFIIIQVRLKSRFDYTLIVILQMLSHVFPGSFQSEDVFTQLIAFVKHEDEIAGG